MVHQFAICSIRVSEKVSDFFSQVDGFVTYSGKVISNVISYLFPKFSFFVPKFWIGKSCETVPDTFTALNYCIAEVFECTPNITKNVLCSQIHCSGDGDDSSGDNCLCEFHVCR